ncbi:hypothetical protein ABEG18_02645 [Alsobacter sp. KACC 23698]|uniref:Glucose-6-phosphate isomerase n=1 Tax=Alsobacter sp. KACC 23698 TaxID=3149229 RepID=A0AAU7JHF3_9HYPH
MAFEHATASALRSSIGEGGVADEAYEAALADVGAALGRFREAVSQAARVPAPGQGRAPRPALLRLAADALQAAASRPAAPARSLFAKPAGRAAAPEPTSADLPPGVAEAARRLAEEGVTDVVVLSGGSTLGAQVTAQLKDYGVPALGVLAPPPRAHFLDGLDPRTVGAVLRRLPLTATRFLAVSGEGGEGGAVMQAIAALEALKRAGLGAAIPQTVVAVVEPAGAGGLGGLRSLVQAHGGVVLEHDQDPPEASSPLGAAGFAALSPTGLLPAAALGLDVSALRRGAFEALRSGLDAAASPRDCAPAAGAALNLAAMRTGRSVAVMAPHADRLALFSRWWAQLWTDALGPGGAASLPLAAPGPADARAQLFYAAGPADKLFTVVTVEPGSDDPPLPGGGPGTDPAADLLAALAHAGRPARRIRLPRLDEAALGALMAHMMLETALVADALGLRPFEGPSAPEPAAPEPAAS